MLIIIGNTIFLHVIGKKYSEKILPVIKRCPLLGGILIKLSQLGLNILSTIQGMSAITKEY